MMRPGAGQNYPRSGFPLEGKAAPGLIPLGKVPGGRDKASRPGPGSPGLSEPAGLEQSSVLGPAGLRPPRGRLRLRAGGSGLAPRQRAVPSGRRERAEPAGRAEAQRALIPLFSRVKSSDLGKKS